MARVEYRRRELGLRSERWQEWSFRVFLACVDSLSCTLNEMGSYWRVVKVPLWLLCGEYTTMSEWARAEAGRSVRRLWLWSKQGMMAAPTKVTKMRSDAEYLFSVMNEISYHMNEGLEKKELKIPKQLEGWRCHQLRWELQQTEHDWEGRAGNTFKIIPWQVRYRRKFIFAYVMMF